MTDRVDAPVNRVQSPYSESMLNHAPPDPEDKQLASRNHPVLALGKAGESVINRRRGGKPFAPYVVVNVCHPSRIDGNLVWVTRETS